jgi:hypothetical protein
MSLGEGVEPPRLLEREEVRFSASKNGIRLRRVDSPRLVVVSLIVGSWGAGQRDH